MSDGVNTVLVVDLDGTLLKSGMLYEPAFPKGLCALREDRLNRFAGQAFSVLSVACAPGDC